MTERYKVNAALMPLSWTPEPWQVVYFPNPNRLNSIWIGTVWNFMLIPTRMWFEVIRLCVTPAWYITPMTLMAVLLSSLKWVLAGFAGKLRALPIDLQTRLHSDIMTPEEAASAIKAGDERAVIDTLAR
jgi:hypothetical protein